MSSQNLRGLDRAVRTGVALQRLPWPFAVLGMLVLSFALWGAIGLVFASLMR